MRMTKRMKKAVSGFLAMTLLLSHVPVPALAAEEGSCPHHVHDGSCGYVEAVEGKPCNHQCGEDCTVTACVHDHEAKGCVYTPARDLVPCDHVHDETCNYNEAEDTCDHQHGECAYQEAVEESWDCAHVCTVDSGCVKTLCAHVCPEDDCGFVEAAGHDCEFVCTECKSQTEDTVQEPSAVDAAKARVAALPTTEQAAAMTEEEKDALSLQLTALDNDLWELVEEEVLPMEEYIGLYEVIDALNAVLIGDAPQLLADVAAVNGTNYSSLADAYNAVPDGGTVTLLANCTVDAFTTDKSFTLDLNGKTITGGITVQDGTLTVKDSGTGGKITGTLLTAFPYFGGVNPRININGGKIGSVYNASGTGGITINGGEIGPIIHASGTLNVRGGTITAETGIDCNDVQGSVNISGGTFNCTTDIIGYGILPITLTGGTFNDGITVANPTDLAEILPENYYYYVDGSDTPATLTEGQQTLSGTVTVKRGPYEIKADGIHGVNCSVSVNKTQARPGETVTITVTPNSGYVLKELSVLCSTDSPYPSLVQWTKVNDNTYTFAMPAADVYLIYATAKKQYTITFKDSANQCTAHSNVTVFEEDKYFLPNYTHHHSDPDKVFAGWVVNGAVKQPGETITIGGNVIIDHKWGNKVKGISLSAEELVVTFYPGDESFALWRTLNATIEPSDATNKTVNWSADNNNVQLYESGNMVSIMPRIDLSQITEATTVITAASAEDPSIKATCTVTYKKHQCTDTTYSATGNTITETCTDPKCGKTNTVTLTVPGNSTYDGTPKKATQQGTFLNPNANPQIVYQFNAEKAEDYAAHTGDPVNAGYYTAALKVGQVSTEAQSFAISKKTLTDLAIANTDKEYDGSVAADDSYISCGGIVEADLVKIAADIAYDDANAGEGKVITATNLKITGDKAGNYCLPADTTDITGTGTITKKPVTVTVDNNLFKTYGDKDPQLTWSASPAPIDGDVLSVQVTREDGETVRDGGYIIAVTEVQGDNPNYEITFEPGIFTIKPKELTVSLTVAKQFDNTTGVDKEKDTFAYELKGLVGDDPVGLSAEAVTAAFAQAETGEDITVTLTGDFALTGDEAVVKNYTLTQPGGATGRIYNTYDAEVGTDYGVSHDGWTNGAVIITAGENRLLATEIGGEWSTELTYSDEAENTDGRTAAFYVKNADGDISLVESVTYKIDKTNPTGTIALDDMNIWDKLVAGIKFGLFFNYEKSVTITDGDALSGVAKIEYLESADALDQAELEAMESESWKEYTAPIPVALDDTKKFVYYAKITDTAGNVFYLSTDGAVYDTSAPVIGIQEGTYYTTQTVEITETNLETLTLNGEDVTAPVMLKGNLDAAYTITATDKAGNETTVTVTMKPIAALDDAIADLTQNNATSGDLEDIQSVLETVTELLEDEVLPQSEKDKLKEIQDHAQNLKDAVEEAQDAIDNEVTQKVEDKTETNVELDDKADLENAKDALEDALTEENKGNYTPGEQAEIQKEIDRLEQVLEVIEQTEAVIDAIDALPKFVEPDLSAKTEKAIRDAKDAYDKLTDYQKSLIDKDDQNKLKKLLDTLDDYEIIQGNGQKWEKGSDKNLVFTVNGPDRKFETLLIDGMVAAHSDYTHKNGSTIITLKASFLQTLTTGKHTIQVVYTDGETDGKDYFRIYNSGSNPSTGDDMNLMLFSGMAVTSLLCLGMMFMFLPEKKGRYQR